MTLDRCPRCRRTCLESEASCVGCGEDLTAIRAELERLMRPMPGATVLPIAVMRRLSPAARGEVARAIEHARATAVTSAERTASDQLLDETVASLAEPPDRTQP